MLKKSFTIVIIQLIGSALGLITIYFVAGSMEPEIYSLVGVYTVVSNIILSFSDLGIETTMMREALFWIEKNDYEKVKEHATQALMSRVFSFCVLLPFLIVYIMYMNYMKYEGNRTLLLMVSLVGALVSSINNAMSLMVRSRGGYIFSQAASTANNYFIKFMGIGLYFRFGAQVYLYFYVLSSIPLFLVYMIKLKGTFKLCYVNWKDMLKKVWHAKFLWLKTDLDYIRNNADGLLVSALFPPAVMGSYTIFKSLEQLARSIIEGFFDVLSQNTVRYKGNREKLMEQERKIKFARNGMIILIAVMLGIFMIYQNDIVRLVRLSKYDSIEKMVVCIAIISIIHLIGKYEINALSFFASSKLNFLLGLIVMAWSICSFVIIIFIPSVEGMLVQRIIVYTVYSATAIIFFRKIRDDIYTKIIQ